ncbi:hypothetical protein CANARDRAFT_212307 [[Candida] arabinofermentans NRRL YB-2248]|uniref:very-long-chain (3R)-3-hydroxyacyl-CoA dehydratase n=1 Tax=[Candida] arabinofermentans NRRL YB-2248 TaxID=983967 RepID=A0A1E4T2P7_9ASCO|nr:hypothetical protein CANARDRAFT_212307 [[Candida] arabinofermentans NRRL YB-2248]
MPVEYTVARYNNTQKYLLISNGIRCFAWFSVNLRFLVLFPLTGIRFLPGGIADFYIFVNLTTILIDLFDYISIFRKIPDGSHVSKPQKFNLICVLLTRLLITFILLNYPKVAKNVCFPILIFTTSLVEFIRYLVNFYKVRTFGGSVYWLNLIKKLSIFFIYPILISSEFGILFLSLQLIKTELGYYSDLIDYDVWVGDLIELIVKIPTQLAKNNVPKPIEIEAIKEKKI